MRLFALAVSMIGMASAAGQAQAQTYYPGYPVCMHVVTWGGSPYEDCSFDTMAQCQMSASGRAATCGLNPFYAGAAAHPRRNDRRYRGAY